MKSYKCIYLRIIEKHKKQQKLNNRIIEYQLGMWMYCIENSKNIRDFIKYPISIPNYCKTFQLKDRLKRNY